MIVEQEARVLRALDDDLWIVHHPLRVFGLALGTRMTVARLPDGLWLHSPIPPTDELEAALAALGPLRWAVAPCSFHHLFVGPWLERGAKGYCARPVASKRDELPWEGVLEGSDSPWEADGIGMLATTCFPLNDEVVFLHLPSRTLILTDLLFHFGPETPLGTRAAMCALGVPPGPRVSPLEWALMKRRIARREISEILDWDFDRIVLAHGAIVETGGKEALRRAYAWLL